MTSQLVSSSGGDDTTNIQSAADAMLNSGGGDVLLDAGDFNLSKINWRGHNCVNLIGKGRNVTRLHPIMDNVHCFELVDTFFNRFADFSIGDEGAATRMPWSAFFFGQDAGTANLINFERIFASGKFAWGPWWNQGAFGVVARDCQFWNYWAAYSVALQGNPQLSSTFGPISQAVQRVGGSMFDNCEAHATISGGVAYRRQTTNGSTWNGGIINAVTFWTQGNDNLNEYRTSSTIYSTDVAGSAPTNA